MTRQALKFGRPGRVGLCLGALLLSWLPAAAQGRLDAQYEATLAGIPVGKGSWTIEVGDDQFSATASGGTSGLLNAIAGGSGNGTSQGRVVNGALIATNFVGSTTTYRKSETIHITLANGNVKEFNIDPQPPVDPGRLPVPDAHRRGVFDPMTGSILRVPGTIDPLSPEACHSSAAVFDGRMRYDLKLDFKRIETVRTERGYRGPVLVCAIYFVPLSGYIPDRPVIKYLIAQRNMEVSFAPLPGTRILVPYRLVIPTPLGTAMLEATTFVTQLLPPRVAKTQ
ncbi:DUF3108 domain-containing protein [Bradyrhizobium sp. NP1]|uniref:DUF3108 domain-containing protein n=1 Tax=Bradyrhizobium sp. NP1 TaxID=3049772 RepID=UPI0025A58135|nr:DUF3108 domain-containing protein [Bradyrhizobium sp. NP1]WJR78061.1 DUF3108 domain-containing protein [Bradyrhizobium sp. NP1]